MVAVYVIIALVFIVCGVWFDFILMGEAVTVFPWLISPICIVAMYIAIRMLRIRGKLQLNTVLIMLAAGGTIKLLVLMQIQPPNVWAGDDMGFVRGLAAYLPQLFNILIAYFTATLSDKEYMKKMAKAAEEATSILNKQIQPLNEVALRVQQINELSLPAERVTSLFSHMSRPDLRESYLKQKREKDKKILWDINAACRKARMSLETEGQTLFELELKLENIKWKKRVQIGSFVVQNLKLKDYTWVMAELKKLQKEAEEDRREKEQGD